MKGGWRYSAAMSSGWRYLDEVLGRGWRWLRLRLEAVGRGRLRLEAVGCGQRQLEGSGGCGWRQSAEGGDSWRLASAGGGGWSSEVHGRGRRRVAAGGRRLEETARPSCLGPAACVAVPMIGERAARRPPAMAWAA